MSTDNPDYKSMLAGFMDNAKKMQSQFAEAYQNLATKHESMTVEGEAGGGLVRVTVNLKFEVQSIDFKEDFLNEKPEIVSELMVAAVNAALGKAHKKIKEEMLEMGKKMGVPPNMPTPFGE